MTPLGVRSAQSATTSGHLLLIGAGLATLWWASSAGGAGGWPLLLVGPTFLAALFLDRTAFRRTPLDLPLLIFAATGIIAMRLAYDPLPAQSKFWMLLAAALLFYALAAQPAPNLLWVARLFAALGLLAATFFLLTHDWNAFPPKFGIVRAIALRWVAVRPAVSLPPLHPNVAGGLMALLIPYQVALAWHAWQRRQSGALLLVAAALLATLVALLLTSSRGAMLALAAGLTLWLLWHQAQKQRALLARHKRPLIIALLLISLAAAVLLLAGGRVWTLARLLDRLPGPASALSRAQLAGHTLDLIGDFGLTGAGLAAFPGLYSHYILGIPHYFLPNGHNIFLDITLEQGFLGALSFLIIVISAVWLLVAHAPSPGAGARTPFAALLSGAAPASFVVLLGHGLVEDTVYGSQLLPLLLVTPGISVALHRRAAPPARVAAWDRLNLAIFGLAAVLFLAAVALPQGRARLSANLGALRMAHVELAGFPTGEWVHIKENEELRRAARLFDDALQRHAQQRTALHRLGLLALERRDFERAAVYLQRAHNLDPHHIGVRKALGYSYAWSGDLQRARQHLVAAPFVAQELDGYVSWWRGQGRPDLAQTATQMRSILQTGSSFEDDADRTVTE